ncbi:tetratricopeptide repeat protein [Fusobacterium varium]
MCFFSNVYLKGIIPLELYKKVEDKDFISICNYSFEKNIIMCNLCRCYLRLNKFEEAEKYLKYVDEIDSFDCYLEVADIFYKAGMKEKAEKYYLEAFKDIKYREYEDSKKKKAKISFCLGEIYLNANKLSSAEEYLKIAVENKYGARVIQLLGAVYEKQSNLGLAKKILLRSKY